MIDQLDLPISSHNSTLPFPFNPHLSFVIEKVEGGDGDDLCESKPGQLHC